MTQEKWQEPAKIGSIVEGIIREIDEQHALSIAHEVLHGDDKVPEEPQTCASCGNKEPFRKEGERATKCPNCGTSYQF